MNKSARPWFISRTFVYRSSLGLVNILPNKILRASTACLLLTCLTFGGQALAVAKNKIIPEAAPTGAYSTKVEMRAGEVNQQTGITAATTSESAAKQQIVLERPALKALVSINDI